MLRTCLLLFCLPLLFSRTAAAEAGLTPASDTLIVLVRHAEKATDDPRDPSLSEAGVARAARLAQSLSAIKVDAIYATQYKRTQMTADPVATQSKVPVTVRPVDATNAPTYAHDLAQDLRTLAPGQSVLVVGHSNTVPEIVRALTGVVVEPITEFEFDRIYFILLSTDGKARLVQLNY